MLACLETRATKTVVNINTPHDSAWLARSEDDDLSRALTTLRRRWRLIGVTWTICIAIALALAFLLPSWWRVEIEVMPVTRNNSVNSGALASLGNLASLGGLGALLGRPASNEDESLAVLRSRELFEEYAKRRDLLPILFASRLDDAGHWDTRFRPAPTLREAYKLFDTKIRDVDLDRRTGIVMLSITWKDRVQAVQWARDLIALTNQRLRDRAIADAQSNMTYLDGEIRRAGASSAQNTLTAALSTAYERALQDYMFARGQSDFAFRVIDDATIPDERERVFPKRLLFAALGLVLGGLLAAAAAFAAEARARRR
jgi:uncharacterized protein involved in exopolysaccharide biosynthesis